MKVLLLAIALLIACSGCTFYKSGSQAISFNPFDWNSRRPAIAPADGFGYVQGEPLDMRR